MNSPAQDSCAKISHPRDNNQYPCQPEGQLQMLEKSFKEGKSASRGTQVRKDWATMSQR
jgi:hypothetical protein